MQLTKSEMEIMETMWICDQPIARHVILAAPHTWKDSRIHILLNSLLRKGAIRGAGMVRRGKTYSRTFAPTMSRETYWAQLAYSGTQEQQPVTPALIAEILFEAQICPDAVPAILAAAISPYPMRKRGRRKRNDY